MALQLVTAADEHVVSALAGDDQIVGDEAVTALNQIENAFGLANAALAGEEKPDAEYIRQRAVQRRGRRKFHFEHRLDPAVELGGLEPGANEWNPRRAGDLPEPRRQSLSLRYEHGRDGEREEQLENLLPLGRRERGEVGDLRFAQDLKTLRRKSLDVPGENESRA
jgi:hypothetical protein